MQYFGPKSVSSGLSAALTVAYVIVGAWFAVAVVGGPFAVLSAYLQIHQPAIPIRPLTLPEGIVLSSWTVALPFVLFEIVAARGAVLIVRKLKVVFASFVANQPFARDNAEHLRRIWVVLVIVEIARSCAFVLALVLPSFFASGSHLPLPREIANPIDLSRWFMIFVVLVLAEVFRRGTLLATEHELTV